MSLEVNIKKKLKNFSLDVNFKTDGKYLGILGSSGSGKSMTLKCIAGIEIPDEGRIIFDGKVLFDSKKKINIRPQDRNIGYLFQNYALFPNMTSEENIGAGLKLSKREKKIKVKKLIKLFHLEGSEKKYPHGLSGGEQQRVALARILAYNPDILMLDEPFSALDSHLKDELQTEIFELLKLYKGEVLMVTHSRDEVYKFCENLAIIDNGTTVLLGKTKDIFNQPKLLSAAKLIGCDNISRCKKLNSHHIYSEDWGLVLESEKEISKKHKYLAIPSNQFQIVNSHKMENTMRCKVDEVIEEISDYKIVFQNKGFESSDKLYFNINKEDWNQRGNKEELYLKINKNAFYLLENR